MPEQPSILHYPVTNAVLAPVFRLFFPQGMPEQPTLIVAYPNKTFKSGETLDRSTVTLEPAKVSEWGHRSAKKFAITI